MIISSAPLYRQRVRSRRFAVVTGLYVASRVFYYLIAVAGTFFLTARHSLAGTDPHPYVYSPVRWLDVFVRFDVNFYLGIARSGYTALQTYPAFFPLWPLMLRGFMALHWDPILAGALFNQLAALAGLLLLADLYEEQTPVRLAAVFLVTPATFFFSVPQTDALFFALTALSLWAAAKHQALLATPAGALVSGLRPQGMLVAAYFACVALAERRWRWLAVAAISATGLALYMWHLDQLFGDPLRFLHAQAAWHRSTTFQFPLVAFFKFDCEPDNFFCAFAALVLIGLRIYRRAPWPETVFVTLLVVMPMSTGTLRSFGRFWLGMIPLQYELLLPTTPRWLRWGYGVQAAIYSVVETFRFGDGTFTF